jgi:hypothetical protein
MKKKNRALSSSKSISEASKVPMSNFQPAPRLKTIAEIEDDIRAIDIAGVFNKRMAQRRKILCCLKYSIDLPVGRADLEGRLQKCLADIERKITLIEKSANIWISSVRKFKKVGDKYVACNASDYYRICGMSNLRLQQKSFKYLLSIGKI